MYGLTKHDGTLFQRLNHHLGINPRIIPDGGVYPQKR